MNNCIICSKDFVYNRTKEGSQDKCNECYSKSKNAIIKYKICQLFNNECFICKFDKCLSALEFHHIDPKEKEFNFSHAASKSWDSIKSELEKCVLLCSNCHRHFHHNCDDYSCKFKKENIIFNTISISDKCPYTSFKKGFLYHGNKVSSSRTHGNREDYKKARIKNNNEKNQEKINKVLNSDIDFTKRGWQKKIAELIGFKSRPNKWISRFMPELYEKYKK